MNAEMEISKNQWRSTGGLCGASMKKYRETCRKEVSVGIFITRSIFFQKLIIFKTSVNRRSGCPEVSSRFSDNSSLTDHMAVDYHHTEGLLAIYIALDSQNSLQYLFPPLKVSDCQDRHILFLQIRLFCSLERKQGNL